MIRKVGHGRWPVLVTGETGTGKEVIARKIHAVEGRGPFVTIDCSSLVGPLLESELFGHVKGAFTGAIANKVGLVELANGGTAFFDEIGELPLDLQAKLLRVLQEHEFRPVGSLRTHHSDFRIIAATNRDLAKEVERGTFRRDLFYRLNVVTLRTPALRDRKEDIPALIEHFLNRFRANKQLSPEALETLVGYDWPGNIRELENCIQHLVAVSTDGAFQVADMPSAVQNHARQRRYQEMSMAAAVGAPAPVAMPVKPVGHAWSAHSLAGSPVLPLMEVERRAILHALEYTRGDRNVAAHLLGIGRTTLYRKLKEYQLAG
jgi:transcriptional regulator with PAS, ATPase and Fis domain